MTAAERNESIASAARLVQLRLRVNRMTWKSISRLKRPHMPLVNSLRVCTLAYHWRIATRLSSCRGLAHYLRRHALRAESATGAISAVPYYRGVVKFCNFSRRDRAGASSFLSFLILGTLEVA
jgi:hypothetical protein